MRTTRVLAGAAALSAALLVAPAGAAAPQVMRGVTTIVADHSGAADLVLYDDATLRLRPDGSTPDITLTGGGRIIGFDLGLSGGNDGLGASRIFRGGKLVTYTGAAGTTYPRPSNCGQVAGTSVVPLTVYGVYEPCPPDQAPKYVVLHQGHYHLTLLADGARVTATIRLRGVPGRSTVRTTKTLASGEQSLSALDTVGTYSRWETRLQLPENADVMMNLDASWPKGPVAADVGGCVYPPSQAEAQTDFLPHCPRGERAGFFGLLLNPLMNDYDPGSLFAVGSTWLDAGGHRLGLYAGSEHGVSVRSVTLAWIEREG